MPEFVEAKTTEQTAERNPFVIWYALAWFLLLLALAFVMRLPLQDTSPEEQSRGLNRRSSFDLMGTDPKSYLGMGTYLARIEEGSVIFSDVLGQVQQTYELPFREAELFSAGGNLFVRSNQSASLLMFRPLGESIVFETGSLVENIAASQERVLLLHKATDSLGEVNLYEKGQSQALLTLSFNESGYPLDMSFHADGQAFDICLLNVNQAQTRTVVQRYSERGEKLAEMILPVSEPLVAIASFPGDIVALYNDETLLLLDLAQGELIFEETFSRIENLVLSANNLALLVSEEGKSDLLLLREKKEGFMLETLESFDNAEGELLLANSAESIFLGQDDLIRVYDFGNGGFLAESKLSEKALNLIAQDNNTLIVLTADNGYLYSLD